MSEETKLTKRRRAGHYVESVVPDSCSVDGVPDALSCLILAAAAALALFPRKRFRMSSLKHVSKK